MENELEGLKYDSLVLNTNVHKLVGKINKLQSGKVGENEIDEGGTWLVTGLGYLKTETPDDIIQESLDDTIILSKLDLIEFIINKKKDE